MRNFKDNILDVFPCILKNLWAISVYHIELPYEFAS